MLLTSFFFLFIDWALLTPDLNFLYLDPVLQSHLQEQAELLIGKSLITFVHPDEQASAKEDLGGVLDSRTLHGSVTRYVPPVWSSPRCIRAVSHINWLVYAIFVHLLLLYVESDFLACLVSEDSSDIKDPVRTGQMRTRLRWTLTIWPWTWLSIGLPMASFSVSCTRL